MKRFSLPPWLVATAAVVTVLCNAERNAVAGDVMILDILRSPVRVMSDTMKSTADVSFEGRRPSSSSLDHLRAVPDGPLIARVPASCHVAHRIVLGVYLPEHACPLLVADYVAQSLGETEND